MDENNESETAWYFTGGTGNGNEMPDMEDGWKL